MARFHDIAGTCYTIIIFAFKLVMLLFGGAFSFSFFLFWFFLVSGLQLVPLIILLLLFRRCYTCANLNIYTDITYPSFLVVAWVLLF